MGFGMNKKIDSLQALRFIACLCIFLHHCYLIKMVYWGVSLFIVLSGFLMCLSYYDRYDAPLSPLVSLRFSLGKIRKLYLLNVLTMLPVLALDIYMMRFHQTYTPEYIATEMVLNLLVVQSWSPAYAFSLNGVAWYLSASMFFYFAFPYILRAIKGYRRSSDPFCAIAVLFALEILLGFAAEPLGRALYGADNSGFVTWFGYIFPVYRCLDFAVGCNLGYIFLRHGDKLTRRGAAVLEGACVLLFAAAALIFRTGSSFLAGDAFKASPLFLPFCAAAVYLFACGRGILPRLFTNRATVFLGNISAAFFLIHQDVIRPGYMLLDRFGLTVEQSRPYLFFIGGAVSVFLAWLYGKLESAVKSRRRQPG